MRRSRDYHKSLIESLKDPKEALAYLNAILDDYIDGEEESHQILLSALKNVAEAQGGIAKLARKTGLGRESLYKTLSGTGNPKWHTLVSLCAALGLNFRLT